MYFDQQIEREKKRRPSNSRLKIGILAAVFLILIAGAVYLIVYSPVFQIKAVEVSGNKELESGKITETARDIAVKQSKLGSILKGNNILLWKNNADFYEKIKSEIPAIFEISINKDYTSRVVNINIKEREKFGIWCQINQQPTTNNQQLAATITDQQSRREVGTSTEASEPTTNNCWWVDQNGVAFIEAPMVEGHLINKVDDFSGRALKLGEPVLSGKFFGNLVKIFDVLEKSGLKIKSLQLRDMALQEVITDPSAVLVPEIYFSLRIDPKFALPAIESMKKIGLTRISYIDLRVENRVYYKTK